MDGKTMECNNGLNCRFFLNGKCRYRHNHPTEEVKCALDARLKTLQDKVIIADLRSKVKEALNSIPKPNAANNFTQDCRHGKNCRLGNQCTFRHSDEELAIFAARRKTKDCMFVRPDGSGCHKGDDCPFRHPKDKLPTENRPC